MRKNANEPQRSGKNGGVKEADGRGRTGR